MIEDLGILECAECGEKMEMKSVDGMLVSSHSCRMLPKLNKAVEEIERKCKNI